MCFGDQADLDRENAVLAGIAYADIFSFPLTEEELPFYIPLVFVSGEQISVILQKLREDGRIEEQDGYLCLVGRSELIIRRRETLSMLQDKWSLIHAHLGPLLGFPWVKAVLLTGSLAARNPADAADADLFLVLDKKRMWLGYLLVRLWCRRVKPIEFCPNYAIAEGAWSLPFPNFFTALELGKSVPLYGHAVLSQLETANAWHTKFLPNVPDMKSRAVSIVPKAGWKTAILSAMVASPLGWCLDRLEQWRLRVRTGGLYQQNGDMYKPHPPRRQLEILKAFRSRLRRYRIVLAALSQHLDEELRHLNKEDAQWHQDPKDACPEANVVATERG